LGGRRYQTFIVKPAGPGSPRSEDRAMCSGGITTRAPTGLLHRNAVQTARPTVNPAGRGLAGVRFSNTLQRTPLHSDESAPNAGRDVQHAAERQLPSSQKTAQSLLNRPQTSRKSPPQLARAPTSVPVVHHTFRIASSLSSGIRHGSGHSPRSLAVSAHNVIDCRVLQGAMRRRRKRSVFGCVLALA
jgi:hypothetical protein